MAYADYEYYTAAYLGTAIQMADFPRLSLRASSFLDYYTQGRAAQNKELDAVKMACCAVAEQYQSIDLAQQAALNALKNSANAGETGELQSQSVGSWAKTYRRKCPAGRDSGAVGTNTSCICCSAVFGRYGPSIPWKGVRLWTCSPML